VSLKNAQKAGDYVKRIFEKHPKFQSFGFERANLES
jgi:hypothetical protein